MEQPQIKISKWFRNSWNNIVNFILYTETTETITKKSGKKVLNLDKVRHALAPCCGGFHYCTTSFNKVWTQILRRFKSCSRRVANSRLWGSLTMVRLEIRRTRISSVNQTAKAIHPHHHIISRETLEQGVKHLQS